jgi:hypothetical protein
VSFLPYPGLEALVDAYTLQGPGRHGLAFSSHNRFLPTSIVPPHTLLYTGKVPIHTQASFLPAQGRDQPGADSWCAEPLPWSEIPSPQRRPLLHHVSYDPCMPREEEQP